MTGFDHPVTRRTMGRWRFSVSGAVPSPSGRRLVVELSGAEGRDDLLRIREEGRQTWVELSIPGLYQRALVTAAGMKRGKDR